jgi:hypothetical protein
MTNRKNYKREETWQIHSVLRQKWSGYPDKFNSWIDAKTVKSII